MRPYLSTVNSMKNKSQSEDFGEDQQTEFNLNATEEVCAICSTQLLSRVEVWGLSKENIVLYFDAANISDSNQWEVWHNEVIPLLEILLFIRFRKIV